MRRIEAFLHASSLRLRAPRAPIQMAGCLLTLSLILALPLPASAQCYEITPGQITSFDGYPGCYDVFLSWSPSQYGGTPETFLITCTQTQQTVPVDGNHISYDWTQLQPGTSYSFTIVARNCSGDSPPTTHNYSTGSGCPATPNVVSVSQGTNPPAPPYVALDYTVNPSGPTPTGFHFYSRDPGVPGSETRLSTSVTGVGLPGTQQEVTLYTDYYQREFAATSYVDNNGQEYESPKSNWMLGWPAGTPIPPVLYGNTFGTPTGSVCYDSPVRLKWYPLDNTVKWNLQVATDENFTTLVVDATDINTVEPASHFFYQDATLQPGQTYYWHLQPISALGAVGTWSAWASFSMGALAITSPAGPVTWDVGSQQTVQWALDCGSGDKVELFAHPTISGDHLTGDSNLLSPAATGGQLTFTVPCVVSNEARIQITRVLPGGITQYAYSPAPITINLPPTNGYGVKSGPGVIVDQIQSTPDGTGGSYVCWSDQSNGQDADVFVARLDPVGMPRTGWPVDVTPKPGIAGDQKEARIVGDGTGGVFVSWTDERNGTNNPDVYALHLDGTGATVSGWGAAAPTYGGIAIVALPYLQEHPSVALASDGALLVSWSDARDFTDNYIYAQKVTAAGAFVWAPNGVQVSEVGHEYNRAAIVSDGQGGAYLSYVDCANLNAFLQRVLAADGSRYWPYYSTLVTQPTSNTPENTPALADLGGGAVMMVYLTLSGSPSPPDLRAYYFNATTQASWDVSVCDATGDQTAPVIVADGTGGATIAWRDNRSGTVAEYAARMLGSGTLASGWPVNGLQIAPAITYNSVWNLPAIAPDGFGGATFAWEVSPDDIFAREVSSAACLGSVVTVCSDGEEQNDPVVVLSTAGKATVAWRDSRCDGNNTGVFASAVTIPNTHAYTTPTVLCYGNVTINFGAYTDASLGAPNYYDVRMSSAPITEANFGSATSLYSGTSNSPISLTVSCSQRTYFATKARYGTCYWSPLSGTWIIGNCRPNCFDGLNSRPVAATPFDLTPSPNPSTGSVRIRYSVRRDQNGQPLELSVYDVRGRVVARLNRGPAVPGIHDVIWNGADVNGRRTAPGLYFLRLQCGDSLLRREQVLIR